tara:strand:+ start:966 stop:1739 length:774 start_codon:yes stop_codon:yes gene_type:complete
MSATHHNFTRANAVIALSLLIIVIFAGPVARLGLCAPLTAFKAAMFASLVGLSICGLLTLWVIIRGLQGEPTPALKAHWKTIVLTGLASGFFWILNAQVGNYPPIHSITTDPSSPPLFEFLTHQREDHWNSLSYPQEKNAPLQLAAYPDIRPVMTTSPPDEAYTTALTVAQSLGWDIVHTSGEKYLIEASQTSFWFGFVDDIAIRVQPHTPPHGAGSRIDLISVSRVGMNDFGANATRLRQFIRAFEKATNQHKPPL